jgi:exodeoxyribonuclease V beta subunit
MLPMLPDYQLFAAAEMPLSPGVNLVEASAGTGKTYAIAMLVLRAVVELEVPIDKILIVTYTRAATEELRSRIRARLLLAKLALETTEHNDRSGDATLNSWLERIADPGAALHRLRLALADIDQAAIFTIHGFCQRVLSEQALACGQLFDMELQSDVSLLRRQVVDDFWRERIYPLAKLPTAFFIAEFADPERLLASVSLVFGEDAGIEPEMPPVAVTLADLDQAIASFFAWWREHGEAVADCCRSGIADRAFKKAFHEGGEGWLAEVDDFCSGRAVDLPGKLHWLTRAGLVDELSGRRFKGEDKKFAYLAEWPLADKEVAVLAEAARAMVLSLRVELAEKLRDEVSIRLAERSRMGFDELILRLANILAGSGGAALRQVVGKRFRVALIDEFQDTDSSQWRIVSTLFDAPGHHLYLIGDPKQAIYRFRGADIHSYFAARQQATRLLTLGRNYRSHPALVSEVNRLFSSRPQPFGYDEAILAYRPVDAARTPDEGDLRLQGKSLAEMVYCQLAPGGDNTGGRWGSGRAAERFCRFTVAEIIALLSSRGRAQLCDEGGERLLAPRDIAILVRSHRQAEVYRQALAEAGVPVVVASRQSVYRTTESYELIQLLEAILAPGDGGRLRVALTITWFGFSGNDVLALFQDQQAFSQFHDRFVEYLRLWREQGFLVMMHRLLEREGVLLNLAGRRFAERKIVNIHHLLELVQEKDQTLGLGGASTLQWLNQMALGVATAEDESELLLESDAEAVRIVTMHGAKGLEYPVVFCPYLWYRHDRSAREVHQLRCREGDRAVVDLGSSRFAKRSREVAAEEDAEELRLLYVALTRARLRCYVMWADVKGHGQLLESFRSALGYLLFPEGTVSEELQNSRFAGIAQNSGVSHRLLSVLEEEYVNYQPDEREELLEHCLPSSRPLHSDWQVTSFSALALLGDHEETVTAGPDRGRSLAALPAGAAFGNLIHALFESIAFHALADESDYQDVFFNLCRRYGVDADYHAVRRLLATVVTTPLQVLPDSDSLPGFTLAELSPDHCLKEMPYSLRLGAFDTDRINAILRDEPTVTPLSWRSIRGYLSGIVDLVCAFDGRYYILHYKTNFLGAALNDYAPEKLPAAMREHNYGLQYWLYSLVLQRHLQNILADYDPRRSFGGVAYLFVRGISPQLPGNGIYFCRPSPEKLAALDQLMTGTGDG